MSNRDLRRAVLLDLGASDGVADELLGYTENVFAFPSSAPNLPDDESFVASWRVYAEEAKRVGAFKSLHDRLIQLRFPIEHGMSGTAAYLEATRRGVFPSNGGGLQLNAPDALRIEIHLTAAGHIPLLITEDRSDFVALVRALTRRNEPVDIPKAMGACMVSGYNNWERIHSYRRRWHRDHAGDPWDHEFASLIRRKDLYQDRFILLSNGPYSGISAGDMGLPDAVWRTASLIIRREHECAHYYTRRVLGSMRNNLLDELIADYMGIREVAGSYRADWFLRFMGLENYPDYREGGRFENYVDGLSSEATAVLRTLLVEAARRLERIAPAFPYADRTEEKAATLRFLTRLTLEQIVVGDMPDLR